MGIVVRSVLLALAFASLTVMPSYADDDSTAGAAPPTRLMLLLDSSGSMKEAAGGGTKIAAARQALTDVIAGLPAAPPVGLRVFGSKVFKRTDSGACDDTELVVPVGTDNRDALNAAVPSYKPWGETPIPAALTAAAGDLGDEGTRVIMLVSDGESTCGDPCPVARELAQTGIDLTINVVGLTVSGKAREQLQCIADAGHGQYYDADNAAEIESTLEHVASRSMRPFRYVGTPIVGGSQSDPTPITAGEWTDTLAGQGATKSYSYELKNATDSVRFVFYEQDDGRSSAAMYVKAFNAAGEPCTFSSAMSQRTSDTRDVMAAQARIGGVTERCAEPGTYRFEVSRDKAASAEVPIGLRVIEEPAMTDPGWVWPADEATAAPVPAAGAPTPLTGAQSFVDARPLTPGSYSGTIVSGESDLVKVHLDYGQSLRVGVAFPAITPAMEKALDDTSIWESQVRLTLYDPTWAQLPNAKSATSIDLAGIDSASSPEATELFDATTAVSSAADGSSTFNGGNTARAGDYYVAVSKRTGENSVEFPFTLTLAVDGTPQQAPTFAKQVPSSSAGASGTSSPAASSTGAEKGERGEGSKAPMIGGIAALVVVVGAVAAWQLRRRARRS